MGKRIGWIVGAVAVALAGCASDFELTLLRAETRDGAAVTAEITQGDSSVVLRVGESTAIDRGPATMRLDTTPPVQCGEQIAGPTRWVCVVEGDFAYAVADVR